MINRDEMVIVCAEYEIRLGLNGVDGLSGNRAAELTLKRSLRWIRFYMDCSSGFLEECYNRIVVEVPESEPIDWKALADDEAIKSQATSWVMKIGE